MSATCPGGRTRRQLVASPRDLRLAGTTGAATLASVNSDSAVAAPPGERTMSSYRRVLSWPSGSSLRSRAASRTAHRQRSADLPAADALFQVARSSSSSTP